MTGGSVVPGGGARLVAAYHVALVVRCQAFGQNSRQEETVEETYSAREIQSQGREEEEYFS